MKTLRTISFVAVVLFLGACPALGALEFNDGLTHNIDYSISGSVWVDWQTPAMYTTVNLLPGGSISSPYMLKGFEYSRINILGGSVYDLVSRGSSQVNMSGGSIGCHLYSSDSSQVNISGGSIGSYLYICDSSQADISGGEIGSYFWIYDSSQVNISGGTIRGPLWPSDNSIIRIFGSDFAVDGQPAGYGELTNIFGGAYYEDPTRYLTGTLASGDLIYVPFNIGQDARIILIPEPATMALLGIGLLFLRKGRVN